jgi:hypothetical protein
MDWDSTTARPTEAKLMELGMQDVANALNG